MYLVKAKFSYNIYGKIINILKQSVANLNPEIAVGKISLGKYTCWINAELETKHEVQLLRVLENAVKIKIPIIIFSGKSVSVSPRKIMNTR